MLAYTLGRYPLERRGSGRPMVLLADAAVTTLDHEFATRAHQLCRCPEPDVAS
jgi:hypothetical protein